jgi:ribosomal protein S6--L-glutamate ligase
MTAIEAVISQIGAELPLCVSILRHLNENLTVYDPQTTIGLLVVHDKLRTSQVLSAANVRTPLNVFAMRANHVAFAIDKAGGLPVVAKQLTSSQGAGVSILETPLSANTTLESFHRGNIPVKLQRFIKAATNSVGQATDIRAIVIGDRVVCAMERTANGGDFRANLSRGGSGRMVTLTATEQQQCVQAAKAVGLEFAGVDLIREYAKAPNFYITEINGNPGTGIIDITGYNYFIDLVMYIETKSGQTAQPPADSSTPADTEPQEEASKYPDDYIALQQMDQYGQSMTATQSGMLAFFRSRYGRIRVQ